MGEGFAMRASILWLAGSLLTLGFAFADVATARARFERALQNHGGEAFAQLTLKGVRLNVEVTSERGGKSDVKITTYRKGEKIRTEIERGGETEIIGFDGKVGWRKQGYLVARIAQEELQSLLDDRYHDFLMLPLLYKEATLVDGEESKLPDGRSGYRVTFQLPSLPHHQSLPKKPSRKVECYLNEKDQVIGLAYEAVDYETDELMRIFEAYHNYRQVATPVGEVLVPFETRLFVNGTQVRNQFFTHLDTREVADSLFERPPSEPPPIVREKLPARVPFQMVRFSLYVEVKINDKGPYLIIFDTGASRSWIDTKIAKEAGLERIPKTDHVLALVYGLVPAYGAKAKSVKIGDAEIKDVIFSVGPLDSTPLGSDEVDGRKVIGLLGREIISAFQITIDFTTRTMTFEPPDAEMPKGVVIPFEMFGDHILVTMGVGDKQQVRMIVDTGAAMNLMPPAFEPDKSSGVWMKLEQWYKRMGEFFEGDEYEFMTGDMRVMRLHKMTLGELRFGPVFAYQKPASTVASDSALMRKGKHGLLGIPIMRHYKITFNYFREQMVWQPHTERERAADNAGYGIQWRRQGKELIIRWVMPLSDADLAGVKAGDRIVLIDGQSPANWSEKQLVDRLLNTKPGRPLKLTVQRGKQQLEFNLVALNYEL
jgi:hypothetical protein